MKASGRGYGIPMTTPKTPPNGSVDDDDQDSEPTMMAPEEGRPDGLTALKDDTGTSEEQGATDDDAPA
jgi:hypothetical protein